MSVSPLQEAVRRAVELNDLSALSDRFAADVEVALTLDVAGSARRTLRGRRSALACLHATQALAARGGDVREIVASDERIVAVLERGLALGPGLAVRSACVLVLDVRDGAIVRLAIHHDLAPELQAPGAGGFDADAAPVEPWGRAA